MKKTVFAALLVVSVATAALLERATRAAPAASDIDSAQVRSQVDARLHALLARMAQDAQQKAQLALADR